MAKKRSRKRNTKKTPLQRKLWLLFALFMLALLGIGFYMKKQLAFYYATRFKEKHETLQNTSSEAQRIEKIIGLHAEKTFGIDMSHYQRKEDVRWDSLSIANGSIPIEFIILRATMGKNGEDRHFNQYWNDAKNAQLIRGAYHFYRPNEDPVSQANWYLKNVQLEKNDLVPILDIEKFPRNKTLEEFHEDLSVYLKIVEEAYGRKPIIYTYYHFYKDYLRGSFENYPLWLANYNDVNIPSEEDLWAFWQFTEKGIVYGINTKVDLNIFNGKTWQLKRYTIH